MTTPIQFGRGPDPIQRVIQDRGGIPMGDAPTDTSFKDSLAKALNDISSVEEHAFSMIDALKQHDPTVSIHDVMAASEEANLSLELLVEVRNKLTEAYRTLMNMQT